MKLSDRIDPTSLVNAYAQQLEQSFQELKHAVPASKIEELAIFLVRAMGAESRDYHRPEHSLDVSKVPHAIPCLAGLFHDLVYLQVDSSWKSMSDCLGPFLPNEAHEINVPQCLNRTQNPWHFAVAALFGVEHETKMTTAFGLNEFLSSIAMVHKISTYLTPLEMLRAVACIEATIFLDKICSIQKTPGDRLRSNLDRAIKKLNLANLSESVFKETESDCQKLIERDLASFASKDLSSYLSNTWSVMSENSPALRNSYYLVSDYRKAVYGVKHFLQNLDPIHMFWGHNTELLDRTAYNLRVGLLYLNSVALSLSIVEAIASATGGDAPYELFVGPIRRAREHERIYLGDLLPVPQKIVCDDDTQVVFKILTEGRALRSRFDQKNVPLAAYLLSAMGPTRVQQMAAAATYLHTPQGEFKEPEKFLAGLPISVLSPIIEGIMKTAKTRSKALESLLSKLKSQI